MLAQPLTNTKGWASLVNPGATQGQSKVITAHGCSISIYHGSYPWSPLYREGESHLNWKGNQRQEPPPKAKQDKAADLAVQKENLEPMGPLKILVTLTEPELLQIPMYTKKPREQKANNKIKTCQKGHKRWGYLLGKRLHSLSLQKGWWSPGYPLRRLKLLSFPNTGIITKLGLLSFLGFLTMTCPSWPKVP